MDQEAPKQGADMQKIIMISVLAGLGTLIIGAAIAFFIRSNDYAVFTDKYYKVQIKYPKKWTVHKDFGGTIVTFVSPVDDSLDNFNENLNISVSDLTADMTLEKFSKIATMQTEAIFEKNIEVVDSGPVVFAGFSAYKYIFRSTQVPEMELGFVWFFKDNRAYVVTYALQVIQYKKYIGMFKYMQNSFTFEQK